MRDDGAADLEVEVAVGWRGRDGARRSQVGPVFAFNVEAAGETELAIDDEDFAMVAEVEGGEPGGAGGAVEERGVDVAGAKGFDDGWAAVFGAHGVDEDANLNAALLGAVEGVDESLANAGSVENVSREGDGFGSAFDGFEHGGISFGAVDERVDGVAGEKLAIGDAAAELGERVEVDGFAREESAFAVAGDGVGSGVMSDHAAAEFDGFCAKTIDAEEEVENWAEDREQPDDEDPKQSGTGFAFVNDGVAGSDEGGENREAPKEDLERQWHWRAQHRRLLEMVRALVCA